MEILSLAFVFFLLMDPIGNIPPFISALKDIPGERKGRVIARECLIALAVMLLFLVAGKHLLAILGISRAALSISAGIIMFLIALRMIFPISDAAANAEIPPGEPFIVPLAVPLFAGPSTLGTALIMVSSDPGKIYLYILSICIAWLLSSVILLSSDRIGKLLRERGVMAVERLTGLVLTAVSVQIFINGVLELLGLPRLPQ